MAFTSNSCRAMLNSVCLDDKRHSNLLSEKVAQHTASKHGCAVQPVVTLVQEAFLGELVLAFEGLRSCVMMMSCRHGLCPCLAQCTQCMLAQSPDRVVQQGCPCAPLMGPLAPAPCTPSLSLLRSLTRTQVADRVVTRSPDTQQRLYLLWVLEIWPSPAAQILGCCYKQCLLLTALP